MSSVAFKPVTAEEFAAFVLRPENRGRRWELDAGEIVETPPPGKKHGLVCANVTRILGNYSAARQQGYVCSSDTGVIVKRDPDTVRGPDVMYFDDATHFDDVDDRFGETPPLLAVEVLSPNDSISQVHRRIQQQLDFGTPLVWLLDPDAATVSVFRRLRQFAVLTDADEITGEDVLPDLKIVVAEFFTLPGGARIGDVSPAFET